MKISLFSRSLNTQGKFLKAKFFVLLVDASVLHIHSGEKMDHSFFHLCFGIFYNMHSFCNGLGWRDNTQYL